MSMTETEKRKRAGYLAIQMHRALTEEAHRISELEDEDVATSRALQRLEQTLSEMLPKGQTADSADRTRALASIRRLQRVVDMRCAEIANIWETRVESLMACAEELRLLTSGQDPQTL